LINDSFADTIHPVIITVGRIYVSRVLRDILFSHTREEASIGSLKCLISWKTL
jgi:hypothetical protein